MVPEDLDLYRLNGWIGKDGRVPDIILNSKWQKGHVQFGEPEAGADEKMLYL